MSLIVKNHSIHCLGITAISYKSHYFWRLKSKTRPLNKLLDFRCWTCIHWNYHSEVQVKETIIRMKAEDKPIPRLTTTLGVTSSAIWYILKKQRMHSLAQQNQKTWKKTWLDHHRILSFLGSEKHAPKWWKKKIMEKKKEQLIIQSIPHCLSDVVEAKSWHGNAWLSTESGH